MATARQWLAGARPHTLPAAVVPVAVGAALAHYQGSPLSPAAFALRAGLALLVALALQVGVNYANDYSDGIRGTDKVRTGPVRLVGQRLAQPAQVRKAALGCFSIAMAVGLLLTWLTSAWWLLLVGLAAILAAWFYTGGPQPYGYVGFGEVMVFIFFGVVAVVGTAYVCGAEVNWLTVTISVPVGLLACALLVINNLRDIPTDRVVGKKTLGVRLGDSKTRKLYLGMLATVFSIIAVVGVIGWVNPTAAPAPALLALLSAPLAIRPIQAVGHGESGPALVKVLVQTGRLQLWFGLLLTAGIGIG